MNRLVWIPVAAFVVLFVGLVVATELGAVDFDWAVGVVALSGCAVEVCVGLGFALDWWREAHPLRPGHFSSSRPYLELPRVSGRPGVGMVADERPVFLSPSLLGGVSAQEGAENLYRNLAGVLGIPQPVELPRSFELVGKCPRCPEVDMHLLGDRDTTTISTTSGTAGPSIGRECRACGHTWKERLDD